MDAYNERESAWAPPCTQPMSPAKSQKSAAVSILRANSAAITYTAMATNSMGFAPVLRAMRPKSSVAGMPTTCTNKMALSMSAAASPFSSPKVVAIRMMVPMPSL